MEQKEKLMLAKIKEIAFDWLHETKVEWEEVVEEFTPDEFEKYVNDLQPKEEVKTLTNEKIAEIDKEFVFFNIDDKVDSIKSIVDIAEEKGIMQEIINDFINTDFAKNDMYEFDDEFRVVIWKREK